MTPWRLLPVALAAGLALAASPASALFGPVCVPHISNCFCTHQIPCPVSDAARSTENASETQSLMQRIKALQDLKSPQDALVKAIGGQSLPIPGLNSIGIDLSSATGAINIPSLDAIGLNADTINGLRNGSIPAGKLGDIAESVGLDRGAISLPGLDGPISAAGDRLASAVDTLNIPLDGIPGLDGLKDAAGAISGGSSAICSAPGSLISTDVEPNEFGDDPAEIDLWITGGGNLETFAEAGPDSISTAEDAVNLALGRSIAVRELLPAALKSVESLREATRLTPQAWMQSGMAMGTLDTSNATSLLREFEGYRSDAYWDVNAYRAGFGSDTVTLADGSVKTITPGTEVTREDAERDLQRRTSDFAARARSQAGSSWDTMPPQTTAALTSIAYNYGSIPNRILPAVQSGDNEAIANAIECLAGDNGGINATRRAREAAIVRGYSSISGNPADPSSVPLESRVAAAQSFQEQLSTSTSLDEDFAINDAIRSQLLVAQAETASMLTTLVSLNAGISINESHIAPVPLGSHDAAFLAMMQSQTRAAESRSALATETRILSEDNAAFVQKTRTAIDDHNLIADATLIGSAVPGVVETIDEHEAQKALLIQLEGRLAGGLAGLYKDPAAAFARLRPQLAAAAGDYLDGDKWGDGAQTAQKLSAALTQQASATSYGARLLYAGAPLMVPGKPDETYRPTYSIIAPVDPMLAMLGGHFGADDPYRLGAAVEYDPLNLPQSMNRVIQAYLETVRRLNYIAAFRRGTAPHTMSGTVWQEMTRGAPECISGPLPYSAAAAAARPELFDLSKECTHLVWSGGDAEDYISPTLLGGADAALWTAKINLDEIQLRTGGPAAADAQARAAVSHARSNNLVGRATALGLKSSADHTERMIQALQSTIADPGFTRRIDFPRE